MDEIEVSALRKNIQVLRDWKLGDPLILEPLQSEDIQVKAALLQSGRSAPKQAIADFEYRLKQKVSLS